MRVKPVLICLLLFGLLACTHESEIPLPQPDDFDLQVSPFLSLDRTAPDYTVQLPAHLLGFSGAQAKPAVAQLGRVLFYDKSLSKDGSISCASCHHQNAGFSDPEKVSTGVYGRLGTRNAMALGSMPWLSGTFVFDSTGKSLLPLFWDHRAGSVAEQSTAAFTNPLEMDLQISEVLEKINQSLFYPWLFQQAFGDTLVTEARVFTALSQFMGSMSSQHTRFDQAMLQAGATDPVADLPGLTPQENEGKTLYRLHCESCHGGLTSPQKVYEANNGLENPYIDKGKGAITNKFYDNGVFRVPMLRNIGKTAPYMHDGRFADLDAVIEHYSSGVVKVFGLHGDLLTYNENTGNYDPRHLNLDPTQKAALKAFLLTLTDEAALSDPRFSDPFK
ncbi:MAG: c-type cytochrome [Lewinellaceae bacterium]|nr:c-type cytochrome [Lewinellaceae bacterium]